MAEQRRRRRRFAAAGEAAEPAAPPASLATAAGMDVPLRVADTVEPRVTPEQQKIMDAIAPPLRTLSDRERADKRAKEILDHGGDIDEGEDIFYFDPANVPDGWSYEWKRKTVHGEENPQYQVQLAQNGWQAVPCERHPEMMPNSGGPYLTIERNGQILMERPAVITDHIRDRDKKRARAQVEVKEKQLRQAPPGTFERGTHPGAPVKVSKSYEKIVLPINE